MIIVDASLAAKWIFWEADSEQALDFWNVNAGHLGAPDLIAVEVAAAAVRRANMEKLLADDMKEALAAWGRIMSGSSLQQFRMTPSRILSASGLAISIGHPLKDCVYLVLAMELDCELVTCDARFAKKAKDVWDRVRVFGA
jgi:predicted nucleic acid-binding protein